MRRKPSYLSRNRQTDIQTQNQHHKCPILQKHNPNNQFGRIEHIATQNHTSRDRLEKQIRNALQTNPMRPILKKNEIRRTTFPRTQSQTFPGISL